MDGFTSVDELGDGYGYRKVRRALGITAFGANVIVMPPDFEGLCTHYHERQDELYFVHRGRVRFEVGEEVQEVGPGALVHVEAATHRRMSNVGDEDLVVLAIGGKDGYVARDGRLVDPERDLERRRAFGG
jgi:mannose-6-phosphate isomerase-like protein (cupin superfamily)